MRLKRGAARAVFPQTDVQLWLVHQVRTSLGYVVSKDQKAVVADLKPIYQGATLAGAEQKLADFAHKWAGRPVPAEVSVGGGKLETKLATFNLFFRVSGRDSHGCLYVIVRFAV